MKNRTCNKPNLHFYLLTSLVIIIFMISCEKTSVDMEETIVEHPVLDSSIAAIIPHIHIQIEGDQEITSKEDYLNAVITIEGKGRYPDLPETTTRIKGRGNSTWHHPKKPYKLKLDEDGSLFGLLAEKDWVLLSNWQDYTLMTNAVAMETGRLLNLPYTNTIIPVDLSINGKYRGNYNLTQQIEVKTNRVNVGKSGVLLEFDDYFDEEGAQFKSAGFNLPVMVKDPDIDSEEQLAAIQADFEKMENLITADDFPNNNYGDYIDKAAAARYILLNNFVGNYEVLHPKSVYMHKTKEGKYTMGPIWDFDWAFGYSELTDTYFNHPNKMLLWEEDEREGARFFARLMQDPEVRSLYKQSWESFRQNDFPALMKFIEEYAARIRDSQANDFEIWRVGDNNLGKSKADMKTYLRERARYIDDYVKSL